MKRFVLYCVVFEIDGTWSQSAHTESLRIARSVAVSAARYSQRVRIMAGGAGGQIVETIR